ncbi:hypothetical protein AB0J21_26680 [Streptomyces sp. NPDC049954]|uniref:hypothetical protein n=1 Tax=Streptomyces sp. NPDC049954 TaxID=3155779 RepID=UPI003439117F
MTTVDAEGGVSMLATYSDFLADFRSEVEAQLAGDPDEGSLALREISFQEDGEGVWVDAVINSVGTAASHTRKRLVIPAGGPDKDGWLAGTIFASSLVEDFDKGRLGP